MIRSRSDLTRKNLTNEKYVRVRISLTKIYLGRCSTDLQNLVIHNLLLNSSLSKGSEPFILII